MVAMADIQAYADEIARRFKPERIVLFGSHAYGTPDEDSDVDLLVIVPTDDEVEQAVEIRSTLKHPGFPLDLLVRDPKVLRWRLEQHDWFLTDVVEKGRLLYEAPDSRMG